MIDLKQHRIQLIKAYGSIQIKNGLSHLPVFPAISEIFAGQYLLTGTLVDIKQPDNPLPKAPAYLGNVGSKQFFVGEGLVTWENAHNECRDYGMRMVTIITVAEYEFIQQKVFQGHGPFWFGARDIGNKSMYRWSESLSAPNPNTTTTTELGSFINFYHYVEQGPLALVMSNAIGNSLFGVHSLKPAAKAFCQSG